MAILLARSLIVVVAVSGACAQSTIAPKQFDVATIKPSALDNGDFAVAIGHDNNVGCPPLLVFNSDDSRRPVPTFLDRIKGVVERLAELDVCPVYPERPVRETCPARPVWWPAPAGSHLSVSRSSEW